MTIRFIEPTLKLLLGDTDLHVSNLCLSNAAVHEVGT